MSKSLSLAEKERLKAAHERHQKAFSNYEDERYAWATLIEYLYRLDYDISEYVPENQQDKFFDWKQDYESRKQAEAEKSLQRFNQSNLLREQKKERRQRNHVT